MVGLGTIINTLAIILGGLGGLLFGRFLKESVQDALCKACGVSTLFLGIAGALEGMLTVEGTGVVSGGTMLVIGCIALGSLIGALLNLEDGMERFGQWLKIKTGNARDARFVDAFVTASLTVCIGAMAIVGSIQDGIKGDYSILAAKAVLDFIIIMVMTCSMGKGCIFSAIPVAIFQGSITALAGLIKPLMTDAALSNLSMIGSILIFCVGVNLVWGKKLQVANMLPAVVLAVAAAFL
ncbi:MAG: DUF554 domain-containing protein [Clostridiales bacterium]|nr:DUF554 domain-containing protein [Clostridiales bacterium]